MKTESAKLLAFAAFLALPTHGIAQTEALDHPALHLQTFASHSRLVLNVDSSAQPKLTTRTSGFELVIPGLGYGDLGAPTLPAHQIESGWLKSIEKQSDGRVSNLTVRETPEGLKIVGRWKFPSGRARPAHPE